jgi:hypothetical protein
MRKVGVGLLDQFASVGPVDPDLHGRAKGFVLGDRYAGQDVMRQLLGPLAGRGSELRKARFFFGSEGNMHLFNLEATEEGVNGSAACHGAIFRFQ